ncbi:MAG TPA: DNA polymerase III subunit delta [Myxococcota bacterium]
MTPEELRASLEAGSLLPVYLVAGEEPLQRDEALAALRAHVLAGAPADFNLDRLEAASISPAELIDALRTLPVMARRRLVELREPDAPRAAGRGLGEALAAQIGELARGSASVLVVIAAKVDRRTRWVRAVGDAATVRCDPPKGRREIAAFIRSEAKRQGVSLAKGVAERLGERVGAQPLLLRQEIAKLSLLAGSEREVTLDHVVAAAVDVAEEPVWDLTDAIGDGRGADAVALLARLARGGAAPPLVLGALAAHFRRLLRLRGGGSLGVPPFVRQKLESQAQRYTESRLVACLGAIHETDLALKGSSPLAPQLSLERLVIGLSARS